MGVYAKFDQSAAANRAVVVFVRADGTPVFYQPTAAVDQDAAEAAYGDALDARYRVGGSDSWERPREAPAVGGGGGGGGQLPAGTALDFSDPANSQYATAPAPLRV